eukprot:gene28900-35852_t
MALGSSPALLCLHYWFDSFICPVPYLRNSFRGTIRRRSKLRCQFICSFEPALFESIHLSFEHQTLNAVLATAICRSSSLPSGNRQALDRHAPLFHRQIHPCSQVRIQVVSHMSPSKPASNPSQQPSATQFLCAVTQPSSRRHSHSRVPSDEPDAVWIFQSVGNVYFSGSMSIVNVPGYPGDGDAPVPVWWSLNGDVHLTDGAVLMGNVLGGRWATVLVQGNPMVHGSIWCRGAVTVSGGATLSLQAYTYPNAFPGTWSPTEAPTFSQAPSVAPSASPTLSIVNPVTIGTLQYMAFFTDSMFYLNTGSSARFLGSLAMSMSFGIEGSDYSVSGSSFRGDAIANQAYRDVNAALADANGRTGGTLITALDGATFLPGLYYWADDSGSAMSFSSGSTLVLDGGGDAASVWIFQSSGSISFQGTMSIVNLPGYPGDGNTAIPVYWAVNSVHLSDGAVVMGNILSYRQTIQVWGDVVVHGAIWTK